VNIQFTYQAPELLLTGSFLLFNSGNNTIAWIFFMCGIVTSIIRIGVDRNEKEEERLERDAQWDDLRQQLLQAQLVMPGSDDDFIKH